MKKKERIYLTIICIVSFLVVINNYYIISKDSTYLHWDTTEYFLKSLNFWEIINAQKTITEKVSETAYQFFYNNPMDKPPFFVLTLIPIYYIIGVSADSAIFSMSFYQVIFIISLYYFGKKIKSEEFGLLISISSAFLPSFAGASRTFLPVLPMCCFIVLTLFFYLKSNHFNEKRPSILFGLFFGFGMLTRYEFFLFVLPWIALDIKKISMSLNKSTLKNIKLSVFFASLIFPVWCFLNIDTLSNYSQSIQTGFFSNDTSFYFKESFYFYLGKILFAVFIWLLIYFIFKVKNKYKKNLLISIIIPAFIFTFIVGAKVSFYFVPAAIFMLLIIFIAAESIKIKPKQLSLPIIVLIIIGFQFIYTQITNGEDFVTDHYPDFLTHYQKEKFDYSSVIDFFKKEGTNGSNLLIACDCDYTPLLYLPKVNSLNLNLQIPLAGLNLGPRHSVDNEKELQNADYIMFFNESIGTLPEYEHNLKENFELHSSEFTLAFSEYSELYNTSYFIYKRIKG